MGIWKLELPPRIYPRIDLGPLGELPRKKQFIHHSFVNLNLCACRTLLTLGMEGKETNHQIIFLQELLSQIEFPRKMGHYLQRSEGNRIGQ